MIEPVVVKSATGVEQSSSEFDKDISIINNFSKNYLDPCRNFVDENPYWAAFYGLFLILFSILAAYKCKSVTGRCRRRRNRRRRNKSSRTYYYLNKSAADNAENVNGDPFLDQQ